MKRISVAALAALAVALAARPVAAQAQDRVVVFGVYGGVYDYFVNVDDTRPTWFDPGYEIGATLGLQLNKYVGIHGDFTYTRGTARGAAPLAGIDFNRFFYGAHVELRYPLAVGFTPFVFAGGGAISIDQLGGTTPIDPFTKPAATYGIGLAYAIPRTNLEVFGEGKNLVYTWDKGGFNRTLVDVTYSAGVSYRFVAW